MPTPPRWPCRRWSRPGIAAARARPTRATSATRSTDPTSWGQRQYRQVWGPDGAQTKDDAYELLDGADQPSYVYRITLSPDPRDQDAGHRLDLRAWTGDVMRQAGPARWVAVSHEQSDHRHVHVVAVSPRRLDVQRLPCHARRRRRTRARQRQGADP